MPTTAATQCGTDSVDAALHLSTRTVAWLADHPQARQFVGSVWGRAATALSR